MDDWTKICQDCGVAPATFSVEVDDDGVAIDDDDAPEGTILKLCRDCVARH